MPVAAPISRERILETARSLPAAPQALAGLCELLQDVNVDLDQIAEQIGVDPALAARVIRMSNSVAFGGGGAIGSVNEAVNRVGFGEVLRLVGAGAVAGLVDRNLVSYGIPAGRMRESLLLHALASEALARFTEINPRTAYTAGLLRAIGMMVIDRVARGWLESDHAYESSRHPTYHDWEGEHIGVANPEVATLILREWRFPAEIVGAIREHYLLRAGSLPDRFACLLNLAGGIVADAGLALAGERDCWVITPAKLAAVDLTDAQWHAARQQARVLFDRQVAALY